jgi:hypothetical protein
MRVVNRMMRAANTAHVALYDTTLGVDVRVARGEDHDRLWARLLELAPFFADCQVKATRRTIPVAVLTPRS